MKDSAPQLHAHQVDVQQKNYTIRFPQVDPAGIVFYPRYVEMIRDCFPDIPFDGPPFEVETEFKSPNRLGDRLQLTGEYDDAQGAWTIRGRFEERECFAMHLQPATSALNEDAHRPDQTAFATPATPIKDWQAGADGRLQWSRYFEILNMAIECWFEEMLHMPFHELHVGQKVGIPTVRFRSRCGALPHVGQEASVWLRVTRIGNRSMTFVSWLVVDNACLVESEQVIVFVRMRDDGYDAIPIPPTWAARASER